MLQQHFWFTLKPGNFATIYLSRGRRGNTTLVNENSCRVIQGKTLMMITILPANNACGIFVSSRVKYQMRWMHMHATTCKRARLQSSQRWLLWPLFYWPYWRESRTLFGLVILSAYSTKWESEKEIISSRRYPRDLLEFGAKYRDFFFSGRSALMYWPWLIYLLSALKQRRMSSTSLASRWS